MIAPPPPVPGGSGAAQSLWRDLWHAVGGWPGLTVKAQKSQLGLWAGGHPVAAVWSAEAALGRPGAPLVVSVFARTRLNGPWKEVVEPAPGRFTHHAELHEPGDLAALIASLRAAMPNDFPAKNQGMAGQGMSEA